MQVVDVDAVLDGVPAEFVGCAVGHAAANAAAGQPHGEAVGMVVAAVGLPSAAGVRPNSPPQITSVSSSRPRLFRSWSRPAIGRSVASGVACVAALEVAVLVPGLEAAGRVVELHEAHASLDQPARQQALPAEDVGRRLIDPVQPPGRLRSRRARSKASGASRCMR